MTGMMVRSGTSKFNSPDNLTNQYDHEMKVKYDIQ